MKYKRFFEKIRTLFLTLPSVITHYSIQLNDSRLLKSEFFMSPHQEMFHRRNKLHIPHSWIWIVIKTLPFLDYLQWYDVYNWQQKHCLFTHWLLTTKWLWNLGLLVSTGTHLAQSYDSSEVKILSAWQLPYRKWCIISSPDCLFLENINIHKSHF